MGLPARLAKTASIWLGSHLPEAGYSRAVQPELKAAVRITRDTCYADSPGDLTAIRTERYQDMSDSEMSTYKHAAV